MDRIHSPIQDLRFLPQQPWAWCATKILCNHLGFRWFDFWIEHQFLSLHSKTSKYQFFSLWSFWNTRNQWWVLWFSLVSNTQNPVILWFQIALLVGIEELSILPQMQKNEFPPAFFSCLSSPRGSSHYYAHKYPTKYQPIHVIHVTHVYDMYDMYWLVS
jgi:hypothetical protein